MASGFHTVNCGNIVVDALMNAGEGGSGCYLKNSAGNNVIGADPYIALIDDAGGWTSSLDLSGTAEVSGGSYARQQAEFSTSSGGTTDNDSNIDFTSMPACTVYAVAICAAGTAAVNDALLGGDLSASKTVNSGDTFRIAAGDLDVTLT